MKCLEALLLAICIASAAERCVVQAEHIIQGDIAMTPETFESYEMDASRDNSPFAPQNAVVRNERNLWVNDVVPFVIDDSLSSNSQALNAINAAMNEYARRTCIRFVQRTNQQDYVRFFSGNGCFSYIGRVGGPQDISIGRGCEFTGVVIHEIFHALGRWHEQSRPDRDSFVRINEENIREGFENNFERASTSFVTTQGVPYDTGSIMHYGARDFSRNGQPTIEPLDSSIPLSSLGQRNGFSESDVQHVNALYCEGSTSASWSSWGSWSSCSRTCNGGTRSRMRVCNGGSSCEGSNIDMQNCNSQSCPVSASWGLWSSWSGCSSTCGGGRQQRIRRCINGNNCVGSTSQFRDCNTQNCPGLPQSWGPWGSWSSCSSTCQGGGTRIRRRICQNGNNCPGAAFETVTCNINVPCNPGPSSGEWSSWSSCTKSCGGGVRFRSRLCGANTCDTQQQNCNTQDCNPEPELRGLQYRGCYYIRTQSPSPFILLEGTTEDLSDDPLTRTDPIRKCGMAAQQFNYAFFGVTLGYCISGSNTLSDYQYVRSSVCQGGVGGFNSGFFAMDVYQIEDQVLFADSISGAFSSAPVISSSSLLLVVSIFMTLISTLLLFR